MTIPITSIVEGKRGRSDKKYGNLDSLAESIKNVGMIQPLVLSRTSSTEWLDNENSPALPREDKFVLVAGGRRYRAIKSLGITELQHAVTLQPGVASYVYEDEVPEHVRKEAELDENLHRLDCDWIDNVLMIADVHAAKKDSQLKWGARQTAALLGGGYGKTKVNYAIRIAKLIRSGDDNILACKSMVDAISVLVKRKEDEALAELHQRTMPKATADMSGFLDTLNINLGGPKKGAQVEAVSVVPTGEHPASPVVGSNPAAPVNVPLSKMFILGNCIEVMSNMPAACVDHIVTDIPYGIDVDNMDTIKNISSVAAEHEVAANVDLMEPFLTQALRLVKSGGFCVFFYDLDWHEYLQSVAEKLGWKIQRWPLIAHKTSACQNNAAQFNFTKNYESIMVLRRDEHTVLRKQQPTSVWSGDFAAERALYHNPFAKPFTLWKWLYDSVSFPGQSVLDPYCGEMSACRAAVNCGLTPFGIEINKEHFARGLENMKAVYALVHKSNVSFT